MKRFQLKDDIQNVYVICPKGSHANATILHYSVPLDSRFFKLCIHISKNILRQICFTYVSFEMNFKQQ